MRLFYRPTVLPLYALSRPSRIVPARSMSTHPSSPSPPRVGEPAREGREMQLLRFIHNQPDIDDIRGHPQRVLDLIDEFAKDDPMVTVGAQKGEIVTDLIKEIKPKTMIELGCYVGYSAILFGDAVRRNGGERYLSLELNSEFAAMANELIALAGLRDFVQIIIGRSDTSLDKLHKSDQLKRIELMFLDHYKPAYTTDLKLCEQLGMIQPGSVLAADNVIYPGNPPYLEYVRSTVEQKRAAAQNGPVHRYNFEGMRNRAIQSYMSKDDVPVFEVVGNPNLVYKSEMHQPEGLQDAIEVTWCVGVQQ